MGDGEKEPKECPVCSHSYFTGRCRGCGYDEMEDEL